MDRETLAYISRRLDLLQERFLNSDSQAAKLLNKIEKEKEVLIELEKENARLQTGSFITEDKILLLNRKIEQEKLALSSVLVETRRIAALSEENKALKEKINEQSSKISSLTEDNQLLRTALNLKINDQEMSTRTEEFEGLKLRYKKFDEHEFLNSQSYIQKNLILENKFQNLYIEYTILKANYENVLGEREAQNGLIKELNKFVEFHERIQKNRGEEGDSLEGSGKKGVDSSKKSKRI